MGWTRGRARPPVVMMLHIEFQLLIFFRYVLPWIGCYWSLVCQFDNGEGWIGRDMDKFAASFASKSKWVGALTIRDRDWFSELQPCVITCLLHYSLQQEQGEWEKKTNMIAEFLIKKKGLNSKELSKLYLSSPWGSGLRLVFKLSVLNLPRRDLHFHSEVISAIFCPGHQV